MSAPLRLLLSIACLSGMSRAAVVNIDFTAGLVPATHTGLAAAPDDAGSSAAWNEVTRYKSTQEARSEFLVDSAGDATSVTISLGIGGSYSSSSGDQELGGAGQGYAGLMSDYLFIDSGNSTVVTTVSGSIAGLVAAQVYDLYFYGQGDKFTGNVYRGQNALFTVDGVSKQTGWDGVQGGDGLLEEGIEFVKFTMQADAQGKISFLWSNVVAGPGGNVVFDEDGTSAGYSAFNALQIVPSGVDTVPEPSGALMTGLGFAALLFRRRRS